MITGKATRREERDKGVDETQTPICFGSYNIRNFRNRALKLALRGMSQTNLNLGFLQETNITDRVYTYGSVGYSTVATDVPI